MVGACDRNIDPKLSAPISSGRNHDLEGYAVRGVADEFCRRHSGDGPDPHPRFHAVASCADAINRKSSESQEASLLQSVPSRVAIAKYLGVALIAVPVLMFAAYSARFGIRGLGLDLSGETYIYTADGPLTNLAVFSHMLLGGMVMVLIPLQLVSRVRRRYPRVHRITGRVIVVASILLALGGLVYIASRGTIAGPLMDVGFALYGGLVLVAATQAIRHARAGNIEVHRQWALRLLVLVMASLIFRVHYVAWFMLTDGLWSNEQLTGAFDQVQYFAFYLPYLAVLEVWMRRRSRRLRRSPPR